MFCCCIAAWLPGRAGSYQKARGLQTAGTSEGVKSDETVLTLKLAQIGNQAGHKTAAEDL